MFNQSLKPFAFVAALLAFGLWAGTLFAQDKDKVIAERQEAMKQQGREMVAVRNYFQGKAEQEAAITAIEALKKSVPKVPEWFPPGTGIGEVTVKTGAKPEIWQQHDKFLADDKTVIGQIDTLEAAVKSGDKAKVETVFNEIKFCNACHETFRARER
ncbi:MAG TPA: cytochrome c [Stellaceae bacterium]